MRIVLAALALAALAAGLLTGAGSARRPAPPLPRTVLRGRAVTIAQLHGHSAAIVFWASWCNDCHAEAAAVERFARSSAGRGRVVGIDYTDAGDWRAFLRRYGWSFPVLADPTGVVGSGFGLHALPATVILDPSGRIASVSNRVQTVGTLQRALAAAA
jgi:cytochrome c biogenesis protein CcmG, thiol:disulfide interchange protein DsbE